jgi:hypothetical protein
MNRGTPKEKTMKDARDPGTQELGLPRSWGAMKDIELTMKQIKDTSSKIEAAYFETIDRMEELKQLGLIYAGTHYKAGKYLYLVYPVQDDGSRERKYIGADPERIAEALAGIERGIEYRRLEERKRQLEHRAHQCWTYLSYAFQQVK